ncbi:condensation domain protein [Segniliparus rotundus DSM 44985]|uniref:Condensation domain protein n=1 Tax=Segniliparus rotundus (strain ATCC BAA-972 / CDC 1076 / CIP 108378 / DSM 44985 / JCM 13578) TaxID=640132 RepID=D6ZCU3_SEGRD|nr:condensation domain-containing protein [Segniliparus rotundus]ADG97135.1 condensation domain protein [Segniliparus rotundus DSM 44985]
MRELGDPEACQNPALQQTNSYGVHISAPQWQPLPGKVWEWRMSAPKELVEPGAPVSPVPPLYIQVQHLRREAERLREGSSDSNVWEAMAIRFAGALDKEALGQAWQVFLSRHDGLRSWFEVPEPAQGGPSDVLRHEVDLDAISWELAEGPEFATGDEAREYFVSQFNARTSPLRWPALYFAAIEHETGFTAIFAEDHCYCDGYSNLVAILEITALYEAAVSGRDAQLPPAGSVLQAAREERERLAPLTLQSPEIQKWAAYLAEFDEEAHRFPLDLGADPDRPSGGPWDFDLLTGAETEVLKQRCKESGGGLAAGLYAALAVTNYELAGRRKFDEFRTVSNRQKGHDASHGWFVGVVPIAFSVEGASSFTDLVSRAQQAIDASAPLASVPVERFFELLADTGFDPAAAGAETKTLPSMVSYFDMRTIAHPVSSKASTYSKVVHPSRTYTRSAQYVWFWRYHDVLNADVFSLANPTAQAALRRYYTHVGDVLRSVVENGDYTLAGSLSAEAAPQTV